MLLVCAVGAEQEATKFKGAMADPEFQAMLRDYMEEIQDPANRAVSERGGSILPHDAQCATHHDKRRGIHVIRCL